MDVDDALVAGEALGLTGDDPWCGLLPDASTAVTVLRAVSDDCPTRRRPLSTTAAGPRIADNLCGGGDRSARVRA